MNKETVQVEAHVLRVNSPHLIKDLHFLYDEHDISFKLEPSYDLYLGTDNGDDYWLGQNDVAYIVDGKILKVEHHN